MSRSTANEALLGSVYRIHTEIHRCVQQIVPHKQCVLVLSVSIRHVRHYKRPDPHIPHAYNLFSELVAAMVPEILECQNLLRGHEGIQNDSNLVNGPRTALWLLCIPISGLAALLIWCLSFITHTPSVNPRLLKAKIEEPKGSHDTPALFAIEAKMNAVPTHRPLLDDYTWMLALQQRLDVDESSSGSSTQPPLPSSSVEATTKAKTDDLPTNPSPSGGPSGTRYPRRALERQSPDLEVFCGICGEQIPAPENIRMPGCEHDFCRDCLRSHTQTKIRERRYPVICPMCTIDPRTSNDPSHIDEPIIVELGVSQSQEDILLELQMASHAVAVKCPGCRQTMNVARDDYFDQNILLCPLSECFHRWCKGCGKSLSNPSEAHRCSSKKLDRLMRKQGWKYCPGCKTPIERQDGCDHMTCRAPGCQVHFCYRCGGLIFDGAKGGSLGEALHAHRKRCWRSIRRYRNLGACTVQ
ncbi:hypothetical protein B0H34DRAFT_410059 [Crassisporium funariophilum]|nr:hypothetical protein B0H34DRAFT_410059 [Crassisporium funariophilum]